jgi:hypothetical protein
MWPQLPLIFALQRLPHGWLVRAPNADPFLPAVRAVAVLEDEPMPMKPDVTTRTRGEIGNIDLRSHLLEPARLLDHLQPPDHRNPELYFEQRSAITHELRRLARWA